jgi:uncharacterized protein DUF3570
MNLRRHIVVSVLGLLVSSGALAGVLPEDRSDILYHYFEGGGVRIDGPSILMRKQIGKSTSFVGNYYVDMISSASIDVITTASPYTEERTQWSLGMDYLRGNTTMSVGYTSSVESDFDAKTYSFSVSQDMFGDQTTLTLTYALGDDVVGRSDDPTFERDIDRQLYGVGVTQILTRNLISTLNFEVVTDEGFLNNPYRSVRYADPNVPRGFSFEPELYPNTRTTTAIGLRMKYFLPWRAAIEGEYRYFSDTWDIKSHTAKLGYTHPIGPFIFHARYRYHDQTGAHFYSDLFPRSQATNFRGRDKELSPLTSQTIGISGSYEFLSGPDSWGFLKRGTINVSYDSLTVDYQEFSDMSAGQPLGMEPLYQLEADIIQIFFSFWY